MELKCPECGKDIGIRIEYPIDSKDALVVDFILELKKVPSTKFSKDIKCPFCGKPLELKLTLKEIEND